MLRHRLFFWPVRAASIGSIATAIACTSLDADVLGDASTRVVNPNNAFASEASVGEASVSDASVSDASISDASISDASVSDASVSDASISDASISDASISDASISDTFAGEASAGEASVSDVVPDAAIANVVWDEDIANGAMGLYPAVAVGPGIDGGSWMVEIQMQYMDPNNDITSQTGVIGGELSPPAVLTQAGPGASPGLTTATPTGSVFTVYPSAATDLWWFQGFLDEMQTGIVWPAGTDFPGVVGYRPRLGSTDFNDGLGPMIVEVNMLDMTPGELEFATLTFDGWSGFTTFDLGPSQNPAIALGPSSGGTAYLVEVNQDSSTNLAFRIATLSAPPFSTFTPSPPSFIQNEHGQHPAVAIYRSTVIEVHEGLEGDLRYMMGTIGPNGLTWNGPSQPYEDAGADPAIAIDETTGRGVEVHGSATHDGTLVAKPFTLR